VRRRDFITLVGSATVMRPLAAIAQEVGRTYRVGALTTGQRNSAPFVAMLDGLRQFGFIEGQNLTIDWHPNSQIDLSVGGSPGGVAREDQNVLFGVQNLAA